MLCFCTVAYICICHFKSNTVFCMGFIETLLRLKEWGWREGCWFQSDFSITWAISLNCWFPILCIYEVGHNISQGCCKALLNEYFKRILTFLVENKWLQITILLLKYWNLTSLVLQINILLLNYSRNVWILSWDAKLTQFFSSLAILCIIFKVNAASWMQRPDT